jgi:hypothetical protein
MNIKSLKYWEIPARKIKIEDTAGMMLGRVVS